MTYNQPKILNEKPPIYDRIIEAGMRFNPDTTIFTYGDTIYNPGEVDIPQDLFVHESVHMRQQLGLEGGPDAWWEIYLASPEWRIGQEAEAYAAQYKYICSKKKNRDRQLRTLVAIGNMLGGPMYGSVITPEAAIRMVQSL